MVLLHRCTHCGFLTTDISEVFTLCPTLSKNAPHKWRSWDLETEAQQAMGILVDHIQRQDGRIQGLEDRLASLEQERE